MKGSKLEGGVVRKTAVGEYFLVIQPVWKEEVCDHYLLAFSVSPFPSRQNPYSLSMMFEFEMRIFLFHCALPVAPCLLAPLPSVPSEYRLSFSF
jgi:hypothetical protein